MYIYIYMYIFIYMYIYIWVYKNDTLLNSNMICSYILYTHTYIYIYISTNMKMIPATNWLHVGKKRAVIQPDQTISLTYRTVCLETSRNGELEPLTSKNGQRSMSTNLKKYQRLTALKAEKKQAVTLSDQTILHTFSSACVEALLQRWCYLTIDLEQ